MIARLRSRAQEEKGFTLIELLVVVLIIGILAAIAIPAFLGQKKSAQDAGAKSILRNAATAAEAYYVDNQTFTSAAALVTALRGNEPGLTFLDAGTAAAATTPEAIGTLVDATTFDSFSLNTFSKSGQAFSWTRDWQGKTTKCKNTNTAPTTGNPATGCTAGTW